MATFRLAFVSTDTGEETADHTAGGMKFVVDSNSKPAGVIGQEITALPFDWAIVSERLKNSNASA